MSLYDVERLQSLYERAYGGTSIPDWDQHDTPNPLIRYLRDRRLSIAISKLTNELGQSVDSLTALVVCGGVGGEGTYLANRGFKSVTVSDFSEQALEICRLRDKRLHTVQQNAEALTFADNSHDVVLVQDGLHELRRPALGLTEMLRVSRRAAIIIEPHAGLVARLIGTVWERHEVEAHGGDGDRHSVENYVFRWNRNRLRDTSHSYLLREIAGVTVVRFWDHNVSLRRIAQLLGGGTLGLGAAKAIYSGLDSSLWWMGNAMVGIVMKTRPSE